MHQGDKELISPLGGTSKDEEQAKDTIIISEGIVDPRGSEVPITPARYSSEGQDQMVPDAFREYDATIAAVGQTYINNDVEPDGAASTTNATSDAPFVSNNALNPLASPRSAVPPSDIKELTIRNLDTGEEYIIGENDPDFEFDTFELSGGDHYRQTMGAPEGEVVEPSGMTDSPSTPNAKEKPSNATAVSVAAASSPIAAVEGTDGNSTTDERKQKEKSLFDVFIEWLFGNSDAKTINPPDARTKDPKNASDASSSGRSSPAKEPKPKTPYTKLSSFKFRRELGKGAFGRVLLAESVVDGKLYAMKIISKANMKQSERRQAKAERDILLAMGNKAPHPFTTGLKFAFQSVNNLYIGMDFLPGGNLKQLIQKFGGLDMPWCQLYAAELVLALSHLHSLNVIYRDLKPHNVMLDAAGHAVLIDYGLSKMEVEDSRGALSLVGTPDYSAPEVLKTGVYRIENAEREKKARRKQDGDNTPSSNTSRSSLVGDSSTIGYGKAADWWSLGIMIYEMISGVPPFRGQNLKLTYQNILYAELKYRPPERFSAPSIELLDRLIDRDPSRRWGARSSDVSQRIMRCSWFCGIDWEAVYRRGGPGPWIPPEDPIITRRKRLQADKEAEEARVREVKVGSRDDGAACGELSPANATVAMGGAAPKQYQDDDIHVPGWDMANEVKHHSHEGDSTVVSEVASNIHVAVSFGGGTRSLPGGGASSGDTKASSGVTAAGSDLNEDPSAQSSSELMNVEDSLLAPSRLPSNALTVADWSYMDKSMLQKAKELKT